MSTLAARLTALSLGIVVAVTAGATAAMLLPSNPVQGYLWFAKEQVFPSPATRLQSAGPPRKAAVLAEIAPLREHAWAGVYRTAGEWPFELAIAPESGFTLYKDSRCGNCAGYVQVGKVHATTGSVLKLQIEHGSAIGRGYRVDDMLHLVRWGELLFAVPQWRMETFCAEASDGSTFPQVPFRSLGTLGECKAETPPRPRGKPLVPSEFEHLLLDHPITCRVVALVEWRRRPDLDYNDHQAFDAVYSIDAGSDDGLAVGMHLFVDGDPQSAEFDGRVEQVDAKTGCFQMFALEETRDRANGLVGRSATTQHPDAPVR